MKAKDIELPRPRMYTLPSKPGKLRRYLRDTAKLVDENSVVRDFLVRGGLSDQVVWVLYPPHYRRETVEDEAA